MAVDERQLMVARAAKGFMPDDEGLALHEAGLEGGRRRTPAGDRVVLRQVGCLPRCRGPRLSDGAVHHRPPSRLGGEPGGVGASRPEVVDPRTGRMDTLPFFRRTIEDAGLEDVVVAVLG